LLTVAFQTHDSVDPRFIGLHGAQSLQLALTA